MLEIKKKIANILLIAFIFLISCGGFKEAGKVLRNEKTTTTDEFLVKKRNPLVLPPNYEEIPTPGSLKEKNENKEEKIKQILKSPRIENPTKKSSSVEDTILDKIRE